MSNEREESDWKSELHEMASRSASAVDDFIDIRWRSLKDRFGWNGVPKIQSYIGYGDGHEALLHGRVLTNPPAALPPPDAEWWNNLLATYERLESDEVANAEVTALVADEQYVTRTDDEGYYHLTVPLQHSVCGEGLFSQVTLHLSDSEQVSPEDSAIVGHVQVPRDADFALISDVDDTIMHTDATNLLTMAKLTLLGNARTRVPLAGVSALYRALQRGKGYDAKNPIFYVSSSPWNLYDLLEDFIALNDIPRGPILLRDLGFDDNKLLAEGHGHKLTKVRRLLTTYSDLRFLLIGDSGQEDADLYASAAEEFGTQILGILIRDVDPAARNSSDAAVGLAAARARQAGVSMHLVQDSSQAAQHAANWGLIDSASLESIRKAAEADATR